VARGGEFNRSKFEQLILYIATRLGPEAALGRVKLAKLLVLSDFVAFARLGETMTGATYEKWEHGHLPHELVMTEKDLLDSGLLRQETVDYYGKPLKHTTAIQDPDMSEFSEDELGIIEGVLKRYGHESASYLRRLSHEEPGWILAEDREAIPPFTLFLSKEGPTAGDIRRGEELASQHGWD
jgi:uncharacterized phage-associated protein